MTGEFTRPSKYHRQNRIRDPLGKRAPMKEIQMRRIVMNPTRLATALLMNLILVVLIAGCVAVPSCAQDGSGGGSSSRQSNNQTTGGAGASRNRASAGSTATGGTPGASEDSNEGTAWSIRKKYFDRHPWAKLFGP